MEREFISLRIALITIGDDGSESAVVQLIADRLAAAGHEIAARTTVRDAEMPLRQQLARWILDPELDVVIAAGDVESEHAAAALAPLVTKPLTGFLDLFRLLVFQEIGAAAVHSNAEAAECSATIVFVLPASLPAVTMGLDKLLLPQLDHRTAPRNLVMAMPRAQQVTPVVQVPNPPKLPSIPSIPAAVPVAIEAEKTASGVGGALRLPAAPVAPVVPLLRAKIPLDDVPTRPIELEQLLPLVSSAAAPETLDAPTKKAISIAALDGSAPPFGGAAVRGSPAVDGSAPPFGGAAVRGSPAVDDSAPPFGGAAVRGSPAIDDAARSPVGRNVLKAPAVEDVTKIGPAPSSEDVTKVAPAPKPEERKTRVATVPREDKTRVAPPPDDKTRVAPPPESEVKTRIAPAPLRDEPTKVVPAPQRDELIKVARRDEPTKVAPVPQRDEPTKVAPVPQRDEPTKVAAAPHQDEPTRGAPTKVAPAMPKPVPAPQVEAPKRVVVVPPLDVEALRGRLPAVPPGADEFLEVEPDDESAPVKPRARVQTPPPILDAKSLVIESETVDAAPAVELPRPPVLPAPPLPARRDDRPGTSGELPRGAFIYPGKPRRRGGRTVLVILGGLLVVALGFFVTVKLFPQHDSPPPPAPPPGDQVAVVTPPPEPTPVVVVDAAVPEEIQMDPITAPPDARVATTPIVVRPNRPVTPVTPPGPGSGSATTKPIDPPPEPKPPEPKPIEPSGEPGCDEVSCALDHYAQPCCERFKKPESTFKPTSGVHDSLDKAMVKEGIERVKPVVIACGEKTPAKGTVKISLAVAGDGHVTSASVDESPDPALGACVAAALRKAKFAQTTNGASFTYPFVF